MKEWKYQNIIEKNNNAKKVSELLKDNNFINPKIIPHSIILSNIKETVEYYNKNEDKDKKSNNNFNKNI